MTEKVDKVQKFFDATNNYLHQSFGIRVRAEIVAELIGTPSDRKILDIGCGNGAISHQFVGGNHVTFLDLSPNMIELARQGVGGGHSENTSFVTGSFLDVELKNDFDYVFAIGLMAHVPSVNDSIKRIESLLKEHGRAVLQFSNYSNVLTKFNVLTSSRYNYDVNKLSYRTMRKAVELAGFEVLKEVQFSFLLPGMGHLPESFLYRYSKFVLQNKLASKLGTDFIWLLGKRGKE